MRRVVERRSRCEKETMALAAGLARRARGGEVVCLEGPLGSGKTVFARGFLRGLGHAGRVTSPTFALVNEYARLSPRVYHLDLYRVGEEDLGGFGLEEYLRDRDAACLIEWPGVARAWLPGDRLEVRISHGPEGTRRLRLKAAGPRSRGLLGGLGRSR